MLGRQAAASQRSANKLALSPPSEKNVIVTKDNAGKNANVYVTWDEGRLTTSRRCGKGSLNQPSGQDLRG